MEGLHAEAALRYKLKLPTGKETVVVEGLRFCYDLSETDAMILFELLKGGEYSVDDLTQILKLSKATVNRSLSKLVEIGFVSRTREKKAGVGRPRYKYYIDDPEAVLLRIIQDFENCSRAFSEALRDILKMIKSHQEKRKTE
ncbi:HTH-type transcriptional regulator Lrs14 [Hyperthermus butylicus]|uniref:HTH-type transcriptional regulator lrs14 n=1 Tax=Hyperthermus butylicus (strain DSM 5456 / JCM 9403 / PLM1-5) TaxID=415426 RepID=A2BM82_HYPBU|nr:HTH-type transcriptional regulator Lrs14 [Hyperthermus butylicus]ABM81093.1 HTH-type transcriptional regulator lrs14 [Hyperthermus butylicus DSM 5456]